MVPWWKRLVYGLVGWLAATCVASLLIWIWVLIMPVWVHTQSTVKRSDSVFEVLSGVFGAFLLVLITVLSVSIVGWVLEIPYVLLVRSSKGWRFWIYLALGTGIGPVIYPFLHSFLTPSGSGRLPAEPIDYGFLGISAAFSAFTTLIYLLLLRRAQRGQKLNKGTTLYDS